jgi:hypothetical protein
MTQAPANRRNIFVERTLDANANNQRIVAVREYAGEVGIDARTAQVAETHLISEGRPASVVDATNVKFLQAMPAPVLPDADSITGTAAQ